MKLYERLLSDRVQPGVTRSAGSLSVNDVFELYNMFGPSGGWLPTTWGASNNEEIIGTVAEAYKRNGPVAALVMARMQVFSQARFQWTRFSGGVPQDLFGTADLAVLERPWLGGTTADLLARMEMYNSAAGNAFVRRIIRGRRGVTGQDRLAVLRPEWMTIIVGSQEDADHPNYAADAEIAGYMYRPRGSTAEAQLFLPEEIAHYAPIPDPDFHFAGMSWITPVLREVQSDDAAEIHKRKFFENAATPNMAIKFDPKVTVEGVKKFQELFEESHKGAFNAYKTLFLGGGADPVSVGANMQQMAFAETQGKGESRLASAAGVPPSWVGFSEGLQGSALNAGNFTAARRRFGDGTMQHLWGNAAASLEVLLQRPPSQPGEAPAQLWHDTRSVPFLREDAKDHAETQGSQAITMQTLINAGYTPDSVTKAVMESDWSQLKHSGLISVQLQDPNKPRTANPGATPATEGKNP